MCLHVGITCPLRPVECPDCHEMQQSNLLASHRKECSKRFVACLNAWTGCREQIRYDYLETHLYLRCQTRLVNCRLACGAKVKFCQRVDHEQNHCIKRLIKCWQCNEDVMAQDITYHLHNTCLYRLIRCTVGCGQMIEAHELEHHEQEVCRSFCKWNCGQKIGPPEVLQLHELTECLLRKKPCPYKCGGDEYMTAGYCEEHMIHHCPNTPMICPNQCGAGKILRKDIPKHIDPIYGDCSERYVRCPSNYVGWKVMVKNHGTIKSTSNDVSASSDEPKSGIVLKYKRFPNSSEIQSADDNFPPAIAWDGVDKLYVRFGDGQRWINFWKNSIVLCEKVTGDKLSSKYVFNEKFDCGSILSGDLNHHLYHECKHRSVYIGAKVPLTAAQIEQQIAREAEEALVKASESIVLNDSQQSIELEVVSQNLDSVSVISDDSADQSLSSLPGSPRKLKKKEKKFKKRENSLFMNTDMSDISYCVEIRPQKMEQCCDNDGSGAPDHICAQTTFIGQEAAAKSRVKMASLRNEVNDFLIAPPEAITCQNCSAEIPPDKMEWHLARDCGHVLSRCGYGCGKQMIRRELPKHMEEECDKRNVKCLKCSKELWAEEMESHLANDCPERIVPCRLGCSEDSILSKDLDNHIMNSCVNRMITCLCGEKVMFKEWPEHDVADCVKKLGQCPQGCGERIPRDEMAEHMEKTCKNKHVWLLRPVKCPIGKCLFGIFFLFFFFLLKTPLCRMWEAHEVY